MAQKTRAQLQAENAALFVENTTGDITPTLEKAFNKDWIDSCMLLAEGTQTTLASAATVNIGAAAANSILITGTTNISAFDTIQAGTVRTLAFLDPAQSLTLVHSSDLLLPNNADFLVAEGYVMEFTSLGAGVWKCTGIQFNYIPQNIASRQDVVLPSWSGDLGYPSTSALVAYSGTEITMADLITLRDAAGMATNQRFIITDSTPSYLMVTAYGTSTLNTTAIRYSTSGTADFGTYDLDTDTFTSVYPGNPYLTISLVDWTALVAANGLVPGWRYRVTSAYEFDAFGFKDIVVTADTINTIEATAYVLFGDFYVPYTTDASFANPGFFLYSYPTMALTGTQALAYSGYNWKFNAGLQMYLTDGSFIFETNIQGVDFSSIIYDNTKALDANGTDWLAGDFGTYDPNTDTFTPNAGPWNPAITIDSTVVTSVTGILQASYSIVNNVISYSILFEGVTIDFTAGDEGWIRIEADQFQKLATAAQVVSGQFNEFFPVGIMAMAGKDYLHILLTDKTTTVTITDKYLSITGQCQA